jgi:hypothetical protein
MSNSSKLVVVAGLVAALGVVAGCGKGDAAATGSGTGTDAAPSGTSAPPTEAEMAKQADDVRKALADANAGKEIKAVAGKDLKALLPETIGASKRSGVESQNIKQMGMDISTTRANYEAEPPADGSDAVKPGFNVEIMDLGNLSGTMAMGFAGWAMTEYDKETETGYEKTTKHKGFPAMEKYDSESKCGELHVYVAKRFVVQVSGHDATIEEIRAVTDAIDVAKLEALAQ